MASRTQARVQQLTGSIIDIAYSGSVSSAAADTAIAGDHLGSLLGELAGAVGRISGKTGTGASAFTNQAAGVFSHGTIKLGGDGDELEIRESGGDITFDVTTADKDIVFTHNTTNTGDNTEIFRIDGSAEVLAMATNKKITFDGTTSTTEGISGDGTDLILDSSTNVNINAAGIDTSGQDINFIIREGQANAFSIDASGGQADLLKVDTSADKVVIHALDVANDVTITGDLTVNGATTTIDTTHLLVEDAFIGLATGSADADVAQGFVFNRSSANLGNLGKTNGVFFFDGDASSGLPLYKLGVTNKKGDSAGEAVTDVGNADLGELRIAALSISGSDNTLNLNAANDELVLSTAASTSITLDAAQDIQLDADSGEVLFQDAGSTGLIVNVATSGDAIFKDAGNAEIFRIDGSENSLLMATNLKIQFRDANAFIHSNDANDLLASATDITLDAGTNLILDGDSEIQLKDGGVQYGVLSGAAGGEIGGLYISASAGNIFLDSSGLGASAGGVFFRDEGTAFALIGADSNQATIGPVSSKDMLFVDDNLGSANEIFRLDSSALALAMPQQNATGNAANTGLLTFNGTTDVNEAIYSDGDALYLRSNAVNFKLPTADGSSGQVLTTNGGAVLTFTDATGDLARWGFKATATVAAGNVNFGASKSSGISSLTPYSGSLEITKADADLDKSLEVFVNGQLLVSGASVDTDRDYTYVDLDSINFAFNLEADDIIQIIQR